MCSQALDALIEERVEYCEQPVVFVGDFNGHFFFYLKVHICKACWNFLSENFAHFPQIAPMEELTKPVKIGIKVWRENYAFFQTFNDKAGNIFFSSVIIAVIITALFSNFPINLNK